MTSDSETFDYRNVQVRHISDLRYFIRVHVVIGFERMGYAYDVVPSLSFRVTRLSTRQSAEWGSDVHHPIDRCDHSADACLRGEEIRLRISRIYWNKVSLQIVPRDASKACSDAKACIVWNCVNIVTTLLDADI